MNCGSRCPLRLKVRDGQIVQVMADNTGNAELGTQQIRACVRGRSIRHRIYNPDRLNTPLKRKPGTKRGDGEWGEISWEQALDEIAEKMKDIKSTYGNEAFYLQYGIGVIGATIARSWLPVETPFARLMNLWGGYLNHYSDYSTAQITSAYPYHYGEWVGSTPSTTSRTPSSRSCSAITRWKIRMSGGGETFVTQKIKQEHGVKTIVFDPKAVRNFCRAR